MSVPTATIPPKRNIPDGTFHHSNSIKGNTAILCAKNSRYGDETERDEVVGMLERTVDEFGLEVPPK